MRGGLSGAFIAVITIAALLAGCATTTPAPVSDRTLPRKPSPPVAVAKPQAPPIVTAKPEAGKPDPAVVVKPLDSADTALYTVKPGDTLFSIARTNGVALRDVAAWNNIEDPSSIRVGQQLRLTPPDGAATAPTPLAPPPTAVEARPIDIVPPTADPNIKTQPLGQRVPYSDQAYAQMSKSTVAVRPDTKPDVKPEVKPEAPRTDGEVDWSWPAEGKVIANFNDGSNKGIVISGKRGQAVLASAGGRVIFSGTGIRGLGKLVVIRHNSNYLSVYAHNDTLLVKEGQTVTRGQRIADMGNSDSDQVKLHFEIRRQGKPVDPVKLLPPT
jgi:lipoprotein NlpD